MTTVTPMVKWLKFIPNIVSLRPFLVNERKRLFSFQCSLVCHARKPMQLFYTIVWLEQGRRMKH